MTLLQNLQLSEIESLVEASTVIRNIHGNTRDDERITLLEDAILNLITYLSDKENEL